MTDKKRDTHFESETTVVMNRFHRYELQRKAQRYHDEVRNLLVRNRLTHKDLVSRGVNISSDTYTRIMVHDPSRTVSRAKLNAVRLALAEKQVA